MACFTVPLAEAIVTAVVSKVVKSHEKETESVRIHLDHDRFEETTKIPFSRKINWLRNMLFGGSALLAFEHVWHGEVTPWFPFLTNAATPESTAEMIHEMATAGVMMAALVTVVWAGMVGVSALIEKRALKSAKENA